MKPMDPAAFEDWARRATPGSSITIARGDVLPAELRPVISQLADRGLVAPCRSRQARGEFLFMAQRTSMQFDRARAVNLQGRGRSRTRRPVRSSAETAILRLIKRAIARGEPCPTNEEFARAAGLAGKISASDRLKRLVRAGKIAIEDHSPFGRRVVTLLATGESTVPAPIQAGAH